MDMILNRLKKNLSHKKNKAKQEGTESYRLYEKDIPEYPYIIDVYKDRILIAEKGLGDDHVETSLRDNHLQDIVQALKNLFKIDDRLIFIKQRKKHNRDQQYEKEESELDQEKTSRFQKESFGHFIVQEEDRRFWVNLEDYIDSGLFLDHRPLRHKLAQWIPQKKTSYFLNLFCYTSTFSVKAAKLKMKTINLDLSRTYLEWSRQNFLLNQLDPAEHIFMQADVTHIIPHLPQEWYGKMDLIYLDPPIFSRSKRMKAPFDIQKDHVQLILSLRSLLAPQGTLIFSTPLQRFKMSEELKEHFAIENITDATIPWDFRNRNIHQCYVLKHLS
jgi:23S rRNA (cytosine1962-C5)-methyltransferase